MTTPITPDQLAASGSESGEQAALFCWAALHTTREEYPELRWLFAVPNGGLRNKVVATQLRAEGVKKGVPDIWLPINRGPWHGLIIELKRPKTEGKRKGQPSQEQRDWINHLRSQGYGAMVCVGWHEARQAICNYLNYKANSPGK